MSTNILTLERPVVLADNQANATSSSNSDFELAQAAAKGDMAAFEELYNRHHLRVYNLCLKMSCNAKDAEDITQMTFLQLFRKVGTFKGDSKFTTWLHRLTVNEVLMHFRRLKQKSRKNEVMSFDDETPDQIVIGTENPNKMPIVDRIALDRAIAQLPKGYRTVFILHDIEGLEHEEVAKTLGCSVGTSKSQLHKARMKLRKLLKKRALPKMHPAK